MSVISNNQLAGAAGQGGAAAGYQIGRSLRFNSGDSTYLNKTFSSSGNPKTFTIALWVKRSVLSTDQNIFNASSSPGQSTTVPRTEFRFNPTNDQLKFAFNSTGSSWKTLETAATFRDVSSWYHIIISVDTTQATASNRVKIYVNGIQQTLSGTYPDQGESLPYGQNYGHSIGNYTNNYNAYFDGYLADVHFIDGQALAPTDFGEYDADTGVWNPIEFTGSHNVTSGYSGTVPNSVTEITPTGPNGNGVALASLLFGGTELTVSQNYIRQDGGGFEWSAAIPLSSGDVAGAKCLYFNNTSNHDIEFKIDGSWVTVQTNANNVIGSTQGQGAIITYTASGSVNWTGVRATNGSNVSVTSVSGIFVNNDLVGSGVTGVNGFHLDFSDNSSNAALGTDSSGNSNTWTVNNLTASAIVYSNGISGNLFGGAATTLFDGSTSTGFYPGTTGTSGTFDVTVTFSPGISCSTLEIYTADKQANATGSVSVDGGSHQSVPGSGSYTTLTAPSDGILNTLVLRRVASSSTSNAFRFNAIKVDGVVLTDGVPANIDSLIDTPTNYEAGSGNNGGNYCTLNPLDKNTLTLANGNLEVTGTTVNQSVRGTIFVSSGKWYYEATVTNVGTETYVGFAGGSYAFDGNTGRAVWRGQGNSGELMKLDASTTGSQGQYTTGDIIGCAIDFDNDRIDWYKNNTLTISYTSAGLSSYAPLAPLIQGGGGSYEVNVNFGQRPFAYTPPTGFLSLCTTNLPDPTIADGSTAFDIDLYTGTGSTHERSEFSFSPDLVWIKQRNTTRNNLLFDTVRGANKFAVSNSSGTPGTGSGMVTSFDSDGFTLGNSADVNQSSGTFCAWCWDGGTSTVSNTDGSITSSVRASQTNGFSVISYTGNNTSGATVGHGLNAAPDFIIIKRLGNENWLTYNRAIGATKAVFLNLTDAAHTNAAWFNNTDPSNSVFTLGSGNAVNNSNGDTYLAYCFSSVSGFSSFGSYEGTGNSDGPFVFCGFKPRWVMYKNIDAAGGWQVYDSARSSSNVADERLQWNNSAEEDTTVGIDILSNGFKLRTTHSRSNASGNTYIWASFASNPFKTARAR